LAGIFDSVGYVRDQYQQRLGGERAQGLEVPFQIDDAVRAAIEGRINVGAAEPVRANQVLEFVFSYLKLQYSLTPTRDAKETFAAAEGNCLSFVNLFVGIAREKRLNPFYVEVRDYNRWSFREGMVVSHGHIVAGMRVDGNLTTYDFLPYRAKSYRDFEAIDDLRAAAHYFNNLAAESLLAGNVERANELAEIAVGLEPDFDKAVNNLAVSLLRLGRAQEAADMLAKSLETHPESVHLLTNLVRAQQQLGNLEEAAAMLGRIEGLDLANPFFYVYRGELALASGDTEKALSYMRKALKQDTELPEVHIGLVKIFLAVGDKERALHHLERALKLDATHNEARRYAGLLLGPAAQDESR
jgi:tetratricopeptide (TPR) repeat protein